MSNLGEADSSIGGRLSNWQDLQIHVSLLNMFQAPFWVYTVIYVTNNSYLLGFNLWVSEWCSVPGIFGRCLLDCPLIQESKEKHHWSLAGRWTLNDFVTTGGVFGCRPEKRSQIFGQFLMKHQIIWGAEVEVIAISIYFNAIRSLSFKDDWRENRNRKPWFYHPI
jgi:hypothetical protein